MLDALTRTSFEPHCQTVFQVVRDDAEPLELELVEAVDKTPEGFDGEQFSLLFRGPLDQPLDQRIYSIEHDAMGRLDLFLVPVDQRKQGFFYEAYFNRAAPSDD